MAKKRHFIGWDRHATEAVREFLIPDKISDYIDLSEVLVVVPTRQSSRRLRESMAAHCAAYDAAIISAQVCVPNAFFRPDDSADYRETTGLLSLSIWSDILYNSSESDFRALFPAKIERNRMWAERSGEGLQHLRETLADGGHTIQSVVENYEEVLEEVDRWHSLAEAERCFLSRVKELGYKDAILRKIEKSENPTVPEGVKRIVVASVPDPSLLMIKALEVLQKKITIEILVLAPETDADMFDEWGRPIPEKWQNKQIDIPDADKTVILAGSPKDQANTAVQAIAKEAHRFGSADIAVGVSDRSVIPFLETILTEKGLNVFDPADKFLKDHPIFGVLDLFVSFYQSKTYSDLRNLIRHPDMLAYIKTQKITPTVLLTDLDIFQNKHLPMYIDDFKRHQNLNSPVHESEKLDNIGAMLKVLEPLLMFFKNNSPDAAIRCFLQEIYQDRLLSSKKSRDLEFISAGEKITEILREYSDCFVNKSAQLSVESPSSGSEPSGSLSILLKVLSEQTYHTERDDLQIDLEGWLELPWNDTPFLISTGMNEGFVPDGQLRDMFLPDSLRRQLDLRNDAGRLARDAYLMTLMIETRRTHGKTVFVVGKMSTAGDPLKPSRLLFRCSQEELVARAKTLFASVEERETHHASTVSFKLNPNLLKAVQNKKDNVAEKDAEEKNSCLVKRLSPTAFRSYLSCPFRFYLSNVMRMRALDDSKDEMDAMDFGSLIHSALQRMGEGDIWQTDNATVIAEFLIAEAESSVKQQFSEIPSVPIQIALDSARQRLTQAANRQVELTRNGWDIIRTEATYDITIDNILVRGVIDRVDQNRDTGAVRIIDYKTSDTEVMPVKAHIANANADSPEYAKVIVAKKDRQWIDLQLPMYLLFLQADGLNCEGAELAYFNLPKAVSKTGISLWKDWNQELLASAHSCAKSIIQRIQDNQFWPPSEKLKYDDFESLFAGGATECFEEIKLPGAGLKGRGGEL